MAAESSMGALAVGHREGLEQLDRAGERVADRGAPAERRAELERLEHHLVVVRERRGDERLRRERDEADAVLVGHLVEEPLDRLLCGHEARRLDVVGLHRPRDVDGQGDRRLLVGDGALDLGRASATTAKISASAASAGGRYERQRDLPATTPASTSMFV